MPACSSTPESVQHAPKSLVLRHAGRLLKAPALTGGSRQLPVAPVCMVGCKNVHFCAGTSFSSGLEYMTVSCCAWPALYQQDLMRPCCACRVQLHQSSPTSSTGVLPLPCGGLAMWWPCHVVFLLCGGLAMWWPCHVVALSCGGLAVLWLAVWWPCRFAGSLAVWWPCRFVDGLAVWWPCRVVWLAVSAAKCFGEHQGEHYSLLAGLLIAV